MKSYLKMLALGATLMSATAMMAQPGGGFGGFGGFQQQSNLETSKEWKDVNYAGDDQAYHTCDIYLPKQEKRHCLMLVMLSYVPTTVRVAMPSGQHKSTISKRSSVSFVGRQRPISSTLLSSQPPASHQVVTSLLCVALPMG